MGYVSIYIFYLNLLILTNQIHFETFIEITLAFSMTNELIMIIVYQDPVYLYCVINHSATNKNSSGVI